ncbi:FxDxF family PEP-CTERM protein [Roseateles saccharophilus]|uniref:Putative secreted protein with PEP-CTERM sorting signal n=1 Tax=Roseateles saccharophilus TaxID=304 RepID=A0A4R3VIT0_ROSSA|nr:FxDxF family PEP-CTERM protein [Roseateles saccharophilus]MDG0832847.1 PEP-CTERM sorting domain-containing protein [Roseateles saccharophilus]TCV03792.1 putative secreted protein with PEP-CTERM sorting signal [Roseateles saccharophilus]
MKLKSVATLSALSLAALAAQATTTDLGSLGTAITTSGGVATSFGSIVNDDFTFSLGVASTVQSSVSTFLGNINPSFYGIYTAGLDHIVGTADDVQVVGHGFSSGNFDTLAAGNYYFKVFGLSNAALSAYSIAASATAVPVPEPETYAMLGAGLAAIGFVVLRRRRD